MLIGILQCGHFPDDLVAKSGDYDAMFHRLLNGYGFDYKTFSVVDGIFPETETVCDGWLITGSRHGAYDDLPWIPPLEVLIRAIHAANLPLVGVCFGHQIIAQALGGRVEKFGGGWSVGRQVYRGDLGEFSLNAWHQDQVITLPKGAHVEAGNEFCRYGALSYGDRVLTVQAHPEFTGMEIDGLIETRGPGVVPAPQLDAARATLRDPVDNANFGARFAALFQQAGPSQKAP